MKDPWCQLAGQILKDLMYLNRVSYKQLSKSLDDMGVVENPRQLTNKINRGQFSLVLFLQCLKALKVDGLEVNWESLMGDQAKPVLTVKNVITSGDNQEKQS